MGQEVIIVEDAINRDWWRKLHVMANSEEALEPYKAWIPDDGLGTSINVSKQAGSWHLRAAWPVRERIDLPTPLGFWPMIAWYVGDGRVSQAIFDGGVAFSLAFGFEPVYAYVLEIPSKGEEFMDVYGMTLMRAGWVPGGFVAVARGAMQQLSVGKWSVAKKEA